MNVPPRAEEFSKLNQNDQEGTAERKRIRDREKKRRQRAAKRQQAAIEFVRTDASLFLDPDRLSQKAGAPKHHLRRMAIKELVDNALDAAPTVTLTGLDADTFVITDDGPGIDPAKVANMFSVTRPMVSSKLIRRPTRGAVGNGLRVATGAAFASGGGLVVESHGICQELRFDRTGETTIVRRESTTVVEGTKITVRFGAALPRDPATTSWGDFAIRLAGDAAKPMLTHPAWYSEASFNEVTSAARGTAQDLASLFGITLCPPVAASNEQARSSNDRGDIDPDGAANTLTLDLLRRLAPKQPKLIPIADNDFNGAYRVVRTSADVADADVPAIIQVWALERPGSRAETDVRLVVNRTPAVADLAIYPGGESYINGCGIPWTSIGPVAKGAYSVVVAVTTPAIALISDGKTPDLTPFRSALVEIIGSAMRLAHRPKKRGVFDKDAAFDMMEAAYMKASANGSLPANARQIMYAARPFILERTGKGKLNDAYFTQNLLPDFIESNPDLTEGWDVVYDARGHLIEPHTGRSIALGTLQVRAYLHHQPRHSDTLFAARSGLHPTAGPGDRYGAVLFIEKEGFEPLLRAAKIAERFDIAIMSTKGMSVIAARKLVDHLSASGIKILVAHDLDAAGLRIFGTLGSDSRRYQFKSTPDVRRLGLTLDQAVEMRLQSEQQVIKGDKDRVLEGLRTHGATEGELKFIGSGHRIELNAMPSDLFVRWLEDGLRQHGVEKVVPTLDVLEKRARHIIAIEYMRQQVRDLEREAHDFSALAELPADLADLVRQQFQMDPSASWEAALASVMEEIQ